ncbi:MAG: fluoride efflux transporter CrcB [Porticoccaceae bacterium]|nr:fluoride efflux transporter CrcB [Porticoccaceae bacterium]
MINWIAVAVGGALGAMARYAVSTLLFDAASHRFPYATLTVNVLGSFIMGILFVVIVEKAVLPPEMRSILMVGFLGAFTTFSTFSLDALGLWQNGDLLMALVYALGTVVLCLAAVAIAVWLTRSFLI